MAFGANTLTDFAGAASDIFAGFGDDAKAQGAAYEAENYTEAAALAKQNAAFTVESTGIQEMQTQRQITAAMGTTRADVAGAGFANSGSSIDLLADAASQGRLTQQVLEKQGQITEAGYNEQAQADTNLAAAATAAENADKNAGIFSDITGALKFAAGLATL